MKSKLEDKDLTLSFKQSGFGNKDDASFWVPVHSKIDSKIRDDLIIEINNGNGGHNYTKDIIHELIHVRQYLSGRLLYVRIPGDKGQYVYWKSRSLGKLDLISYRMRPWEKEARKLELLYWKKYERIRKRKHRAALGRR